MLYKLRKKVEDKRGSKKILWKFLVWVKDFCYFFCEYLAGLRDKVKELKPVLLNRLDSNVIPQSPGEILAFMVVRNEAIRLPYLLKYYAGKAVDRFFIVDNGSTDGTIPFLLSQKNVHLFESKESFGKSHFGKRWRKALLKKYAEGHWCIIADADEILVYPHYEKVSLRQLCSFLDAEGKTSMSSLLLDMYSDKTVRSTAYRPGENLLSTFPYFDGTQDDIFETVVRDMHWQWGGMRRRVFGIDSLLTKTCIVKYSHGVIVHDGHHWAENVTVSKIKGSVLHFKYISDFTRLVIEEAHREEHWRGALEYKEMAKKILANPDFSLHYSGSVRLEGSGQLVKLGIMKTSPAFENYAADLSAT
jgi:glycosyltransferase involved in cell wall biosynthesis